MTNDFNRRDFMKKVAGGAVSAGAALPALGRAKTVSASDKAIVGVVGAGQMGQGDLSGCAQQRDAEIAAPLRLIPQPVSVQVLPGAFRLHRGTAILISPGVPEARQVGVYLANAVAAPIGLHLKVAEAAKGSARRGAIVLTLTGGQQGSAHPEGYDLEVTRRGVRIQAPSAAGLFYGVQTLLQLFPPEIESKVRHEASWALPCVKIVDYPRFAWRGLMLDVSRQFFSKEFVEQYIDQMAKYKMNVIHLHLTDDQGWRIEIKRRPQLTTVGAWRVPRLGRLWEREPPRAGEAATEGGFYTQDDIREIVAYAKERFITVVPEIELPGHSLAALAAYPEFSCTGGPFRVNPGSKFYGEVDNALCPGNEGTFEFLDQVLSEVAPLFPSPYVHIGGDECFKGFWKKCPKCQRRMAEEHLKDENELQSYFIRRVEKILAAKNKRLIGWDEILQGGLAPNATVMSWRGMKGGIAAAKMNHQVVMAPANYTYLDLYQGDPALEPTAYSQLLVSTCYRFEPVPEGVDPKYILGGQGNLWTEFVTNPRAAEYMTWPRAFALAEVFWSPKETRNWDGFIRRMEAHFQRLDAAQVNYSRAVYDVAMTPVRDSDGKLAVRLSTELSGCDIYYTFDGTNPDNFMTKYQGDPVESPPPGDAYVVKAIAYRSGRPSGRLLSLEVEELTQRLGVEKK
ncbi:MAG TPA: family 20 glycosylhydrolase [Terriglobia bacterium]|nr:family 20 glycosylhydrolase [Terriglobia bacterium]